MTTDPVNTHMNQVIRGTIARRRQPRNSQGRFAAEQHDNPDVAKLLKLRALCADAGDLQGVGEMDMKIRAIDPQLASRLSSIDPGAGRNQGGVPGHVDGSAEMNALLRGASRYRRERIAELQAEELRWR
jgi:hypothetical protein